jgi:hypothetical protein
LKILLVQTKDSHELDEREGWGEDLVREYDEAHVALGIVPGWTPVILKGPGDLTVLEAGKKKDKWLLAFGSPDESECVSEGQKL